MACWAGAIVAFAALAVVRHTPGGLLGVVLALQTPQPYPKLLADVVLTALLVVLVLMPAGVGHTARVCLNGCWRGRRSLRSGWSPTASSSGT